MSSSELPGPLPWAVPAWKREILERKRAKLAGVAGEPERFCLGGSSKQGPAAACPESPGEEEPRVVAESLGPLRENPFMRLESERRRLRLRQERQLCPGGGGSGAGVEQLLELYSAVPGLRTIRADNILIIESQPDPGPACFAPSSPRDWGRDPLRELLLARRGAPVTEIRAAQVLIYESPEPPPSSLEAAELGRVSRLLQKFDQRPWGGRRRRSEEEPPLPESSAPLPKPPRSPPARPGPGSLQPSGFMHKIGSNSFTVTPRGQRPASRAAPAKPPGGRTAPPSPSALPARANTCRPKPEGAEEAPPTRPCASLDRSAIASPLSAPSSNGSFEIRPAPKPDLAAIPAQDLQAQALANLRLKSRNSFIFVPRRGEALSPPKPAGTRPPSEPGCEWHGEPLAAAPKEQAPVTPLETSVPVTYIDSDILELEAGDLPLGTGTGSALEYLDLPQEASPALGMEDSAVPLYRPHSVSFDFPQKGGNTFTVMPKRKPTTPGLETFRGTGRAIPQEEEEEEEEEEERAKHRAGGVPEVLPTNVMTRVKKRYPTVNEIEVIGGYLSLERSCISKTGSRRKKMKISFNESSLQTMFEYPSESSLVDEDDEEEEEEEEYASEVDEKPCSVFIPRPNSTLQSSTPNSGLSSYTPKHSLEFSKWQEQHYEKSPGTRSVPWDADLPRSEVMLTPADKSGLSDFSSEPALYF
uniref:Taperin n=1 Tax=Sphenodon punctatus TaxID=8508 RepID=A0A8D0L7F3_SPHPU